MEMNRGDVVITTAPGDYGKPRPAVVIQSDLFNPTHASIVVCPITSDLMDTSLFRLTVQPEPVTGLKRESQIMVDKMTALRSDRIKRKAGRLSDSQMAKLDAALRLWLDLDSR
jgi:mRNA interferase MazF